MARSTSGGSDPATGVSLQEMMAVAAEVGLDPALVERAARQLPAHSTVSPMERVMGGPMKHRFDVHFATQLTESTAARLLSAVRAAVEQQGEGEAGPSGVSWHSVDKGSQIFLTANAEGEGTRFRLIVDRSGPFVTTVVSSLLGALGVAAMSVVGFEIIELGSVPLGLALMGGGMAGALALGRTVWVSTTHRCREKADALVEAVSRSLAGASSVPASSEDTRQCEGAERDTIRLPDGGAS